MFNLIRADLYRITRSKGFYITAVLLAASIIFMGTGGVFYFSQTENNDSGSHFEVVTSEDDVLTGMTAPFRAMDNIEIFLYFLLPFIVFTACADFSAKTVKNVLANDMSRGKYYLSKLILCSVLCAAVYHISIILYTCIAIISNGFGGEFTTAFIGQVLRPFSAQLFLYIAITCVSIFFVFVTKKTAAVIGTYMAFCFAPSIIIAILFMINNDMEFLFGYDIVANIRMLADIDTAEQADIIRAFAVGGFYIIASIIGGIAIFKRSEIK
jgi:ABC-2 type transport system permease protein